MPVIFGKSFGGAEFSVGVPAFLFLLPAWPMLSVSPKGLTVLSFQYFRTESTSRSFTPLIGLQQGVVWVCLKTFSSRHLWANLRRGRVWRLYWRARHFLEISPPSDSSSSETGRYLPRCRSPFRPQGCSTRSSLWGRSHMNPCRQSWRQATSVSRRSLERATRRSRYRRSRYSNIWPWPDR